MNETKSKRKPAKITLLFKTSEDIPLEEIEKRVRRVLKLYPESRILIRVVQ